MVIFMGKLKFEVQKVGYKWFGGYNGNKDVTSGSDWQPRCQNWEASLPLAIRPGLHALPPLLNCGGYYLTFRFCAVRVTVRAVTITRALRM